MLTIAPEVGWAYPYNWLFLTIGVVSLICLFLWEYINDTPMIPSVIWRDKTLAMVGIFAPLVCCSPANKTVQLIVFNFLAAMGTYSTICWVCMFMQTMQNLSPLEVAIRFIPQALIGLGIGPIMAFAVHAVNNSLILAVSAFLQVSCSVILVFLRSESSYWVFAFPTLLFITLPMDWALTVTSVGLLALHDQESS